jgi:signal transduction protein with GAF and PtsI domain
VSEPRERSGRTRRQTGSAGAALLAEIAERAEAARRLELGSGAAVLRSIVDATVRLFEAEAASIALHDTSADRLVFVVASGEQGAGVVGLAIPPDQGLVGYVFSTGQAIALADVRNDARFGRAFAEQTQYVPRSIVAVPLLDEQGTLGVLEVLDKRSSEAFSLRDIELAGVFAQQAAVAIRASRVERETTEIIRSALGGLARSTGVRSDPATVEALVDQATAGVSRDDDSGLWRLVDSVARVRRADPAQLDLVADLLAVLATHTERRRQARPGRGTGRLRRAMADEPTLE